MNYCNWLFDTKDKDLEREIIIDWETGKRLTFKGLQTEVVRLANFLKSKGYVPGTVIATHLYNGIEAAVAFWPPNISDVLFALWIRFLRRTKCRTMLKTPVPNV